MKGKLSILSATLVLSMAFTKPAAVLPAREGVSAPTPDCVNCSEGFGNYGPTIYAYWNPGDVCGENDQGCIDCSEHPCVGGYFESTDGGEVGAWLADNGCGSFQACYGEGRLALTNLAAVREALKLPTEKSTERIYELLAESLGKVKFNAGRGMLQVYGCKGIQSQIKVSEAVAAALVSN